MEFASLLSAGMAYNDFLASYGTPGQRERWHEVRRKIRLQSQQIEVLRGFRREMHVICLAGVWCGDCAEQCPIFDAFAAEAPTVHLHFFDRDEHPKLASELSICGGKRVPSVVFLNEDGQPTGRYGDRTLTKYRRMAAMLEGDACSSGLSVDEDLLAAVTQEWLNEFERNQLIMRTSPRLRERHGD